MLTLMADRFVIVALEGRVEVTVGEWIEKEIRSVESCWPRGQVVVYCVGVEEFTRVIRVVACFLEPEGEVGRVKTLGYEFGVAAVRRSDVCYLDHLVSMSYLLM